MAAVPVEMEEQVGGDSQSQGSFQASPSPSPSKGSFSTKEKSESSNPVEMDEQAEGEGPRKGSFPTKEKSESSEPPPIYPETEILYPPRQSGGVIVCLEPDGERLSGKASEPTAENSLPKIIGSVRSNFISSECYYRRGKFWSTSVVCSLGKTKQYYRRGKFWPA